MAVKDIVATFVDRQGDRFDLSPYSGEYREALKNMYDNFTPKAITQGLPPASAQARLEWLEYLIETGENFLAWAGAEIVGHCALIPETERSRGEYLIFVDQPYRNRGLGTALTQLAIRRADELGMEAVWLTVEALNFKAVKLYRKIGFVFCDSGERERTMILRL